MNRLHRGCKKVAVMEVRQFEWLCKILKYNLNNILLFFFSQILVLFNCKQFTFSVEILCHRVSFMFFCVHFYIVKNDQKIMICKMNGRKYSKTTIFIQNIQKQQDL